MAQTLTPAQHRADELVEMLWRAANHLRDMPGAARSLEQEARALLRDVTPYDPPTLAEALDVLAAIRASGATGVGIENGRAADDLLERARATGVMK